MLAIQPLDLLPPCSVTFRDYALAVLRAEQVANPADPQGYRAMMLDIFIKRGILTGSGPQALWRPGRCSIVCRSTSSTPSIHRGFARRRLSLSRRQSRQAAHSAQCGLIVSEIVRANKWTQIGRALPEQIIVQYICARSCCSRVNGSADSPVSGPRCCAAPPWCSTRTATRFIGPASLAARESATGKRR